MLAQNTNLTKWWCLTELVCCLYSIFTRQTAILTTELVFLQVGSILDAIIAASAFHFWDRGFNPHFRLMTLNVNEISQRSADSRGFSPRTLVFSHRECWLGGLGKISLTLRNLCQFGAKIYYKSLIQIFRYKLVLDSDAEEFGGHKRVQPGCEYVVDEMNYNDRPFSTLVRRPYTTNVCSANSHLSTLVNSHGTLVPIWPGHESWENCHTHSRLSTLINSHATLVLVWPGHESWENSHTNSRLSTLINSHATLVLVWPGHESWENSHTNSCLSTRFSSFTLLLFI